MGLFSSPQPPPPYLVPESEPAYLVSSAGYSITPTSKPDVSDSSTILWHRRAWYIYDHLAEVAQASRLTANTASLAEIVPGKIVGAHTVPISLDDDEPDSSEDKLAFDVANECYHSIFGETSASVVLRLIVENLFVTGEVWLVQSFDPGTSRAIKGELEVIPGVDIITRSKTIADIESGYRDHLGQDHWFTPNQTAIRFCVAHPRNVSQPISSVRSILDEAESLLLLRQLLNATASSGIHSNILGIPEELTLATTREQFQADMVQGLSAPLVDPNSAATVAPHLLIGKAEFLEKVKLIVLRRDFDEQLPLLMQRLETRIIRGLDLPSETLEGMGGSNHWSSWAINANWVRNHIQPVINVILETLTRRVLWPKLVKAGVAHFQKYCFIADLTNLAGQPNLASNALDAYRLGVLSHEALLRHLGIPAEDIADPIRASLGSTGFGSGSQQDDTTTDSTVGTGTKSTERKNGVNPDRNDQDKNMPVQGQDKAQGPGPGK